jgi:hypothetical protein
MALVPIINFTDDTYLKQSLQVMKRSMLHIPTGKFIGHFSYLACKWAFVPEFSVIFSLRTGCLFSELMDRNESKGDPP